MISRVPHAMTPENLRPFEIIFDLLALHIAVLELEQKLPSHLFRVPAINCVSATLDALQDGSEGVDQDGRPMRHVVRSTIAET